METYSLNFHPIFPLFKHNDLFVLLDTRADVSMGSQPIFSLFGKKHPLTFDYMGVKVTDLTKHLEKQVDVLLGVDILNDLNYLVNVKDNQLVLSEVPLDFDGTIVGSEFYLGKPLIRVEVGGKQLQLIVGTGSGLSYLPTRLIDFVEPSPEVNDFHPSLGAFRTVTSKSVLNIGPFSFETQVGKFPKPLERIMSRSGVDGILGAEAIKHFTLYVSKVGGVIGIKK